MDNSTIPFLLIELFYNRKNWAFAITHYFAVLSNVGHAKLNFNVTGIERQKFNRIKEHVVLRKKGQDPGRKVNTKDAFVCTVFHKIVISVKKLALHPYIDTAKVVIRVDIHCKVVRGVGRAFRVWVALK